MAYRLNNILYIVFFSVESIILFWIKVNSFRMKHFPKLHDHMLIAKVRLIELAGCGSLGRNSDILEAKLAH